MNDTTLHDELVRMIRAKGAISVARYMELCLAHPKFGYYRCAEVIGAGGDFVTAPEISQIFGELIGIWVAATWQQMGEPEQFALVELGPGRGTMMRDVLRTLRVVPGLPERVKPILVEISPHLRSVQRATLAESDQKIQWVETLNEVAAMQAPVVILANEFFDALPITQYINRAGQWRERAVGLDADDELVFVDGDIANTLSERKTAKVGDVWETRIPALRSGDPSLQDSLKTLVANRHVALLAIDYGYEGPAAGDTLQAMRAQSYAEVLKNPGEQDLTAHVDFAELAEVCAEAGLQSDGLITQAAFLSGLGFGARLGGLLDGKNAKQANAIETAAHRLVAEPGMGNHFRVMGARSTDLPPLIPFPLPVDAVPE